MRVFKTRSFNRFMKRSALSDRVLREAVLEMARGLIDANLGGYVVKKRVAVAGQGKRGGARTIVATRFKENWFFIYGFMKNERSSVRQDELRALQEVAKDLVTLNNRQLEVAIRAGELVEVKHADGKT